MLWERALWLSLWAQGGGWQGTHSRAVAAGQHRTEAFQGGRDRFWCQGLLPGLKRAAGGSFLPAHKGPLCSEPKGESQ